MDRLVDFGLPGLVFLALLIWLIRKAARAARTESDLEGERLSGAFADELRAARELAAAAQKGPRLVKPQPEPPVPAGPLDGADTRGASEEHLQLIEALVREREAALRSAETGESDVPRRVELLWARSTANHAVWCERRHAATQAAAAMTRDVICVARVEDGKAAERWSY